MRLPAIRSRRWSGSNTPRSQLPRTASKRTDGYAALRTATSASPSPQWSTRVTSGCRSIASFRLDVLPCESETTRICMPGPPAAIYTLQPPAYRTSQGLPRWHVTYCRATSVSISLSYATAYITQMPLSIAYPELIRVNTTYSNVQRQETDCASFISESDTTRSHSLVATHQTKAIPSGNSRMQR